VSRIAVACWGIIEEAAADVREGGGRVKEGGNSALKKLEVRRGPAVATSTTSHRGSVIEVGGRAAMPSKSEAVASMQVEHAR
jgi:hypothetical protein